MFTAPWTLALALMLQASTPTTAVSAAWPDDRPLTHILQNFVHDAGQLPSRTNAAILAIGVVGTIVAHPADQPLSTWVTNAGTTSYTAPGRVLGNAITQASVALGTYAIGKVSGRAEITHIGGDLIRAQFLNGVITETLKTVVDRDRPTGSPHSFPSGHASASFATAAVLAGHFNWETGAAAYAAAGYVGWTRLRDNQHWLSDVVLGSTIGLLAGHTVTVGHRARAWTIVPSAARGGMGVSVLWTPSQR